MTDETSYQGALLHYQAGRIDVAESTCCAILERQPGHPDALLLLGIINHQRGDNAAALESLRAAVAARPEDSLFHLNLAVVLSADDQLEAAVAACREAIALRPAFSEAYLRLGSMLRQQGLLDDAVQAFREVLRLQPESFVACYNLGNALRATGDVSGAADCYRQALQLNPGFMPACNNLGSLLLERGCPGEAIEVFRQALRIDAGFYEAQHNLGKALHDLGRYEEAIGHFRQAIRIRPDSIASHSLLAGCLLSTGRVSEVAELRQVLLAMIDALPLDSCPADVDVLIYLCPFLSIDKARQDKLAGIYENGLVVGDCLHAGDLAGEGGKLRIGYVSPNFGDHPIGHVTRGVFEHHDTRECEIYIYSLQDRSGDPSIHWQDIRRNCTVFRDLSGLTDLAAARLIAADRIHILVDLTGFMKSARLQIFAYRPVPVQVYWLGHGGGLGLSFIDYVIADPVVVPPGTEALYREGIARLPEVFHPADTPPVAPASPSRSDAGLAEDAFVFCAFNTPHKIDITVFATWMRILHRVPGSQLWLSQPAGAVSLADNLRAEARRCDVAPDRLVFAGRLTDKAEHFARHRLADLFLDSFSVNAATTAIDALWAGLPVITLQGEIFQARICSSLLVNLGLSDLVCSSMREYESRAVSLAQDAVALAGLRARLQASRLTAPLFNPARFTRHLETAYAAMWQQYRSVGVPLRSLDVPRLPG